MTIPPQTFSAPSQSRALPRTQIDYNYTDNNYKETANGQTR